MRGSRQRIRPAGIATAQELLHGNLAVPIILSRGLAPISSPSCHLNLLGSASQRLSPDLCNAPKFTAQLDRSTDVNHHTSGRNYGKGNRIFFQLNVLAGPHADPTVIQDRWIQSGPETPGSMLTLDTIDDFAPGVLDVAGRLPRRAPRLVRLSFRLELFVAGQSSRRVLDLSLIHI